MRLAMMAMGATALLLAGCNRSDTGNASGNAAANASSDASAENAAMAASPADAGNAAAGNAAAAAPAAGAVSLQAGSWKETGSLVSVEFPGAPPGPMLDRARKALTENANRTQNRCMTAAEAADAFPKKAPQGCTFERYAVGGGKVDVAVRCPSPQGDRVNLVSGSYTPTTTDLVNTIEGPMQGGGRLKATLRMRGERVGAC